MVHKQRCFRDYIPVILHTDTAASQLEAAENAYIQHHQSNSTTYPFICNHMKGAFSGLNTAANNKRSGSSTLWVKLRRGHLPTTARDFNRTPLFRTRNRAWQTISQLCSNKRIRFDTTKQLLRTEPPLSSVYALHKLASICRAETSVLRAKHSAASSRKEGYDHRSPTSRSLYCR